MSIESERQRLLLAARQDLDRARQTPGMWTSARSGLLWALQYDRRAEDLPLLRVLLAQEIAEEDSAVPGADLELAAFLLAEQRQPEDVETITAAVRAEVPLEEWLSDRKAKFPTDPAEENLRSYAHHAARLGDRDAARQFLLAWADSGPRSERVLNALQHNLAHLGFLEEAIKAQQEAIELSRPPAKISRLLTLVRLQRRNHDFEAARRTLLAIETDLPYDKHGFEHPWRSFVKELFLLVPEAPEERTARRLLEAADQNLQGIPRLWKDEILDAAIAASDHVGDPEALHRYASLREAAYRDREYQL
ncbi:MAG: hypothetical protein ABIS86_22855 [Streptosporangiaceae bacterium]